MADAQRLINPWMLHLQKLGLELKCPLCLQLFKQPVLLPCNHIFCTLCLPKAGQLESECPACKHQYVDREVKPAPFMENIVTIYQNIDATFSADLIHSVCSDVSTKCTASFKTGFNKSSKEEGAEIAQEGNSSNGQFMPARPTLVSGSAEGSAARSSGICVTPESGQKQEFKMPSHDKHTVFNLTEQAVAEKQPEMVVDGVGLIKLEQLSPSLSGNSSKDMNFNSSDPSNSHMNVERFSQKRPADCDDESNKRYKCGKPLPSGKSTVDLDTLKMNSCAFCHSSDQTEGSGPLVAYAQGKEVTGPVAKFSKVTYAHEKCINWAPQIFFADGLIHNLESEVARASKLKCNSCGKKGAGLGCYVNSCQKTYHVPCAYNIYDCRWDCDNFLLLCPTHASRKFPSEQKSKAGKQGTVPKSSTLEISMQPKPCTTGKDLVLCGSALSRAEKCSLVEFAGMRQATLSKRFTPEVTHVIAATDSEGACTRTLKVLMAILNGKWIITTDWLKACMEAGHLVDEEPYEVRLDAHGCTGGPKAGRLRVLNNAPKLFNNMKFYFTGDFVERFMTDLSQLVTTAGGTVMDDKELLLPSSTNADADKVTLVVYNTDLSTHSKFEDGQSVKSQRLAAAEDIARESGSVVVGHTWILEAVAASSLMPFN